MCPNRYRTSADSFKPKARRLQPAHSTTLGHSGDQHTRIAPPVHVTSAVVRPLETDHLRLHSNSIRIHLKRSDFEGYFTVHIFRGAGDDLVALHRSRGRTTRRRTHYVTVTFLIRASARHNLAPKKPTTVPKAPADKPGANFRTLEFTEGWEATYLPATPQNRTPTGSSRT